jgi:hypothetical protein
VSSFFASVRTIFRPITLTVVLVAGLHLSIGVLALRAIVHPAATATMVTAAKTEPSAKAATPVKTAEATPAARAKAPVPVTADATADASSPAVAKPAGQATLFGPLLLARGGGGDRL